MLTKLGLKAVKMLPPEMAHVATVRVLSRGVGAPLTRKKDDPRLAVTLPKSGLKLRNPVGLAAGFDKNCEAAAAMSRFGFGFVECGTVTPRAQLGNPRPRLFRLEEDRAVINRMGFNNHGLKAFARRLKSYRGAALIGANIGANKTSEDRAKDYVICMQGVWAHADYLTINVSSPNTPNLRGLQDKDALRDLLGICGATADTLEGAEGVIRPVFLKVAPDLDSDAIEDICEVLRAEGAWLAGLIVSNTTTQRQDNLQSAEKDEAGGLSGAPLMALSTKVLRAFSGELKGEFDLIGVGGIASGADAFEKLKAGAHAVQIYSALIYEGPGLVAQINNELADLV